MRIEGGKLVLELQPCWQCNGALKVNEWVKCQACNGTGKADPQKPKGRNCKVCSKYSGGLTKGQVLSIGTAICHCATTATPGQQMETVST